MLCCCGAAALTTPLDGFRYEQLLALGERLGDVRQERWRLRAPAIIASLPTRTFHAPQRDGAHDDEAPTGVVAASPSPAPVGSPTPPSGVAVDVEDVHPAIEDADDDDDSHVAAAQVQDASIASSVNMSAATGGLVRANISALNLTDSTLDASGAERCLVCQCSFDDGDVVKTLPCDHEYHAECIDQWLGDHDTCPLCNHSVDPRRRSSILLAASPRESIESLRSAPATVGQAATTIGGDVATPAPVAASPMAATPSPQRRLSTATA